MELGSHSSVSQSSSQLNSGGQIKRALVLPGGGGRGAYQVGVAKALMEIGLTFDFAFGTSIGALNATMIAQGDLKRLEELWCTMKAKDIYCLPSAPQIGRLVLGHHLGILDNSPLEELLRRELNLPKLKASSTKVGICTTDLCSLQTSFITTDDMVSSTEMIDVLMATSALPMAFPPRHLHGSGLWVDGGLVRNTPMDAALAMGADEIYMVLLHPAKINICPTNLFEVLSRCLDIVLDASARKEIQSAELYNRLLAEGNQESRGRRMISIKVFQPKRAVNTTLLDIDPERSRKLIEQGYEEAREQLADYGMLKQPQAAHAKAC
jgi:predicted acylesterase/phospholipase RssA